MMTDALSRTIRNENSPATKDQVIENDIGIIRVIILVVIGWFEKVSEIYKNDFLLQGIIVRKMLNASS
jgi:hypothetical protein